MSNHLRFFIFFRLFLKYFIPVHIPKEEEDVMTGAQSCLITGSQSRTKRPIERPWPPTNYCLPSATTGNLRTQKLRSVDQEIQLSL